jgi:hypothetical protein
MAKKPKKKKADETNQANKDEKNIKYLETRYMYESRQKVYLANEETNQAWDESDIPDFIKAWNNNWPLNEIAEYLGADQWEIHLLAVDLIKQGKIKGNVHIFKPKNKKGPKQMDINMGDFTIRTVRHDNELWLCVKDIWRWIGKPEHSYRKVTEGWGPDRRAKFKMETKGGSQRHIFINMSGLSQLFNHVEKNQSEQLEQLKEVMNDGLGISSGDKGIANKKKSK